MNSLFTGAQSLGCSEILFRAICAVGWALRDRLEELREACMDTDVDWPDVVDIIEKACIHGYEPSGGEGSHLVDDARRNLDSLAQGEKFRGMPAIAAIVHSA